MATEIVFTDTTRLVTVKQHPADLAEQIARHEGANWAGNYLFLDVKGEIGSAWVNPANIAYLREMSD